MDISELENIVSRFVLAFDDVAYNLQETARYYDRYGNRIRLTLNTVSKESHYAAITIDQASRQGGSITVSYTVRVGSETFPVKVTHSKTSKVREAFPQLPITQDVIAFFTALGD